MTLQASILAEISCPTCGRDMKERNTRASGRFLVCNLGHQFDLRKEYAISQGSMSGGYPGAIVDSPEILSGGFPVDPSLTQPEILICGRGRGL